MAKKVDVLLDAFVFLFTVFVTLFVIKQLPMGINIFIFSAPEQILCCSSGLYTGTAGVSYSLYYLVEANLFPERNDEFLRMAQAYLDAAMHKESMRWEFFAPVFQLMPCHLSKNFLKLRF